MESEEVREIATRFVRAEFDGKLKLLSCGRTGLPVDWEEVLSETSFPDEKKAALLAELSKPRPKELPRWSVSFLADYNNRDQIRLINVDVDEISGQARYDVRNVEFATNALRARLRKADDSPDEQPQLRDGGDQS